MVTFIEKESLFSSEKFRMSVRKAMYQLIHGELEKAGKAPSPGSFIDCSSEWAEQSSLALPLEDLGKDVPQRWASVGASWPDSLWR